MRNLVSVRTLRHPFVFGASVAIAWWLLFSAQETVLADDMSAIGYTQLKAKLGAARPTGLTFTASQVEAGEKHTIDGVDYYYYRPDESSTEFSGKTFNNRSGTPTDPSGHATTVGTILYGNSGMASAVNTIDSWYADNWLPAGLHFEYQNWFAPEVENRDVQNHSWVGTFTSSEDPGHAKAIEITRRFDFAIQRDDFVAVVGVNNGSSTTLPDLLCQNYNGISVGLTNGDHSHGLTTFDGTGRRKPDIVAPAGATSWSTPMVGASAAMLLHTGKALGGSVATDAMHSETIKAVLLAGATKKEFPTWSHSHAQPLDTTYGAGELNIYNSYFIMAGGEQEASSSALVNKTGWDFSQSLASGNEKLYFFDVPTMPTLGELSAVLTWNREITPSWPSSTSNLANLDLDLWSASGFTRVSELDWSASTVDNVELLRVTGLVPGRYVLGVSSDTAGIDYGLSWSVVPEPNAFAMLLGIGAAWLICLWRRKRTGVSF
jgi:hypothetical protein